MSWTQYPMQVDILVSRHPQHVRIAAEPRHLTPRIAPGERLALGDGLGLCHGAGELRERLRIADRAARGGPLLESAGPQRLHLVEKPAGPHALDAGVQSADQLVTRSREAEHGRGAPRRGLIRKRRSV